MRKLLWCCSAAGVLAAGGFLSLTYYACRNPDSMLGRGMYAVAEASISMQPMSGLASLVAQANGHNAPGEAGGSVEECVPEDPQPVRHEPEKIPGAMVVQIEPKVEIEFAEIIVPDEDVQPSEPVVQAASATIDMDGVQELPATNCPIIMPSCRDGNEQPMTPPRMPLADEGDDKPAAAEAKKADKSHEESESGVFEAWKKVFESGAEKSNTAEMLPAPTEEEEPQAEPKCEEDCHRHEQYPGCPHVTCPYTGKSYPSCTPSKSTGKEESSEEPMEHPKKPHAGKSGTDKDDGPHPAGVDTMEYRKSDAGLNEYDPGRVH